jgi:hypothetical protein
VKEIKVDSFMKLCLSGKEGKKLRKIIEDNLMNNESIILDFSNINVFASPFFNLSLGYFVNKFGPDEYYKKIKVTNLSPVGQNTYNQVIENSIEYYNSENKEQFNEIIENSEN